MYVTNLHIPQENDFQKNGKDVRDYVCYYNCDKYYHKKTVYCGSLEQHVVYGSLCTTIIIRWVEKPRTKAYIVSFSLFPMRIAKHGMLKYIVVCSRLPHVKKI
jgi:hypothetical protein